MSTRPRLLRGGSAAGLAGGPGGSPALLSFAKGLCPNGSPLELLSLMNGTIVAQAGSFEKRQNRFHGPHGTAHP
jgi:hypothetical protein